MEEPCSCHLLIPIACLPTNRRVWNPTPIRKPVIIADLERLPWLERSAKVIRQFLHGNRPGWESDLRVSRERHACRVAQTRQEEIMV